MKRIQSEYSENGITYWPSYEAGRIGLIFFSVLGTLFIATSILALLDNPSRETRSGILIALPIVVIALCATLRFVYRAMQIKFVVSDAGIAYFENTAVPKTQISWEDVTGIYFEQELWHGRKSCKIILNEALYPAHLTKDGCVFILPVYSVDTQILLKFIPNHLWKNHPWYS